MADNNKAEPNFYGYQLMGDSQFVRFAEQRMWQERTKRNGHDSIGLCVSGQKIDQLCAKVMDNFYPTSERVVLMIGTNDILKGTEFNQMEFGLGFLLSVLMERQVKCIILLTIPPVPLLATKEDHWNRLQRYNDLIKSRHDDKNIFVVDAYFHFVDRLSPVTWPSIFHQHDSEIGLSVHRLSLFGGINCGQPSEKLVVKKGVMRITVHNNKRKVQEGDDLDSCVSTALSSTGSYHSPNTWRCNHENINIDLFEEYFSGGRKDLIHLNSKGLRVLEFLITRKIMHLKE